MKTIISANIHRTDYSLPENIQPELDPVEEQIFGYLRSAAEAAPVLGFGSIPNVRVAGGWVRDKLMPGLRGMSKIHPKDIDIAIDNMSGEEFAQLLLTFDKVNGNKIYHIGASRDPTAQKVEITHGHINVPGGGNYDVEFTQLRKESYGITGDRKSIETKPGSLEEDAFRRDLTINALYYNINSGRVEDVTGHGYEDLARLNLETPARPGKSKEKEIFRIMTEDPVRVLRVLRFHSRWPDAQIDTELLQVIGRDDVQELVIRKLRDASLNKEDPGVSREGVADELRKIMKGARPADTIQSLYELGLLQKILNLPDRFEPFEMDQRNRHHQMTLIEHTIEVLRNTNKLSIEFNFSPDQRMMMNFASLFHDLGKLDPQSHLNKDDGTRSYMGDQQGNPNAISHQQSSAIQWRNFANVMKMTNHEKKFVSDLVEGHMNPHAHVESNVESNEISDKSLRRYIRKNPQWVFQYVHAMADAMSKTKTPNANATIPYRENLERLRGLAPTADRFGKAAPSNDLLNGNEIIRIVGLPPKPLPGMTGYIEVVKERIREEQDTNPISY